MKAKPIAADADTLLLYALALRSLGQLSEALTQCLAAVDASNGREDAVLLAAEMMRQGGKTEQAAALLRGWIEKHPPSGECLASLGKTLRQLGYTREAMAAYEEALQADLGCLDASSGLAHLLIKCGRPAEAASHVMQAAPAVGDPLHFLMGAATVFAHSGFENIAESFLIEAEKMDPDDDEVRHIAAFIRKENPPVQASPEYIRASYARHASSFDVNLAEVGYAGPEIVRTTLEGLIGDRAARLDILDAGCGTGLCGPGLRPFAGKLVGADLSPEMLRQARGRACYDELVELNLLDAERVFGPVFDLVVCSDVLIHFGPLDRVLAGLRRCLTENGSLILTLEAGQPVSGSPGYQIQPTGRYKHTAGYLRNTLLEIGFRDIPVMKADVLRYELGVPVQSFTVVAVTD